jgi:uncharacterized membrane-anchored protein
MKKYKSILILSNLVLVLFLFHRSTWKKEQVLKNGDLVLFQLAPVDPRSLMQGDYMRLNYAIAQSLHPKNQRGYLIVRKNEQGVAEKVRLQATVQPLENGESAIRFNKPDWQTTIGAESFFFQEGQGKKFEKAKFGGIRVDKNGNSLLEGLYDKDLKRIP